MGKPNSSGTIKIILINVTIFVIGFITVDYIIGQFKIPYNYNSFRTKHPYYHHGLIPNISQYAAWGKHLYMFHTNSIGLRDSAIREIPTEPDKKRILIIGDSHCEGVGVEFEHTFAGILQRSPKNHQAEILNASAVSYSPRIYFLKVDYLLNTLKLDADEVWVFIDISDLQNEIAYEKFAPDTEHPYYMSKQRLIKFLEKKSFTYYTIKLQKETKKIGDFVRKMNEFNPSMTKKLQKNTVELYEDFFRDFDNDDLLRSPEFHGVGEWYYKPETMPLAIKGLSLGQKNIQKLDSLCSSKGIKLVLSIHPWHTQVFEQKHEDYYVLSWKKFCAEHDIEFLNLFPLFINGENPYSVVKRYYIPNDNHWNEEGHKKVADYFLKRLENESVK